MYKKICSLSFLCELRNGHFQSPVRIQKRDNHWVSELSRLAQPGWRIPVTLSAEPFAEDLGLGRRVIWPHTFGELFADPKAGRPPGPPLYITGKHRAFPKTAATTAAGNSVLACLRLAVI